MYMYAAEIRKSSSSYANLLSDVIYILSKLNIVCEAIAPTISNAMVRDLYK